MAAPIATRFNALGWSNGFPAWGEFDFEVDPTVWHDVPLDGKCALKVDVSGFAHVAPMDIFAASKMFWNLHKVAGTAIRGVYSLNMDNAIGMTPWDYEDVESYILAGAPATKPNDRTCNRITITNSGHDFSGTETNVVFYRAALPLFPDSGPDDLDPHILIDIFPPDRYYDGVVTNEDNFIGYGFGLGSSTFAEALAGDAAAGYASAVETTLGIGLGPIAGTWAKTTVSGIPVLEFTQTSTPTAGNSATLGEFEFYEYTDPA